MIGGLGYRFFSEAAADGGIVVDAEYVIFTSYIRTASAAFVENILSNDTLLHKYLSACGYKKKIIRASRVGNIIE